MSPRRISRYILLVEDNRDDEELAVRALRACAVENLQIARDGEQALDFLFARGQYADRNPDELPAAVLLDLKLPKLNGIEVLRALRADERTRALPVVVLSSSREACDVSASYESGTNSFVRKPIAFGEYAETVGQIGRYWYVLNELPGWPLRPRGG